MSENARKCLFCGRVFIPWMDNKEYCSRACGSKAFFANNPEYHKAWRRKKKPSLDVECRHCGNVFQTYSSKKIFCCNECKINHHNVMRPTTKEELRECPICKTIFRPIQKTGIGRTYCTPKCRDKAMNQRRKSATTRKHWKNQKNKWNGNWFRALERDSFTCQICGRQRKPHEQTHEKRYILEVHHKDGSGETKNKNHDLDNLTTLCHDCHSEFHTKINLIQIGNEFFIKGKIFDIIGIKQIKTIF